MIMQGYDAIIFLIFFGLFFLVLGTLIVGTVFGAIIITIPHNVIEKKYCLNHPEFENTTRCYRY